MAEDLQRILECPMCFEFYDSTRRIPKLLQCQHTYCLECILKLEKGHVIICPQCRKEQACPQGGANKIANNFTMLALIDVHQKTSMAKSPVGKHNTGDTEVNAQPKSQQPAIKTPQVSENVRKAIASLAQKLQGRSNVIKRFDVKEKKTKDSFLGVKKEIECSFDARIQDLTARRNVLIKQLGEIGKEEISFIQTQKSSALQYLQKFQDDFLKMKQIFHSGSPPSEMELMQLLNLCQGYNRQIDDYALSVDERTCEISFSSPTLEQLLISMNSYGCLTVSKQKKTLIASLNQDPIPSNHRPPATVSQTQVNASSSPANPFQSKGAVDNRYEYCPEQCSPNPLFSSLTPSPSQTGSTALTRHLSLDVTSSSIPDARHIARSSPGLSPGQPVPRRRPMSTSFSSGLLSATSEESRTPESSSPSSTRSSSPALNPPRQVNRSRSNPSLVQANHMISPVTGHTPRSSSSNYHHGNPSAVGTPINILGPDVTGRSIFEKPSGIVPLGGSMVAIVDEIKHCLMIVTDKGQMVQVLGSQGNGVGEFQFPKAICTSPENQYIISDWWNHRIQIWDSQGRSLGHFGKRGSAQNQLNGPVGVACDSKGNIFVCDFNNHCVKIFTKEGKFLRQIGKEGSRDGQFLNPSGIVLSKAGEVLVTDSGKHCVQVFTQGGTYLYRFGEWGAEPGQLNCPSGITVDSSGYIYVANRGNHRVEVFNPSGSYARCLGTHGSDVGQFDEPIGLAALDDGRIAVCDSGNKRIQMIRL